MAHIVIAEDDDIVADLVREVLTAAGHVVGVLGDGVSAFKAIRLKRPDLAILDCTIPEMTGIEVLRKMRITPEIYDIPVLMLTARRGSEDVKLALLAGANRYMKKPFEPDRLVFVVDEMLETRRSSDD